MNVFSAVLTLILIVLIVPDIFSQEDEITNNSYFYPNVKRDTRFISTLGLSTAELPEELIETEGILRAPLFYYRAKYRLPLNLILEGGAETNIITYRFSLAPGWSYNYKKYGFSAASEVTWWHGRLKQNGFNSEITGWQLIPNLSTGYNFPYFTLTLRTEFTLILSQVSKIESIKEEIKQETFAGYSFALYLEQPLWKDHYIVIGIKSNFTKFYSPVWAAFPTFDRFIYISEIIIGFNI